MKKILSFATVAAVLLSLTACRKSTESDYSTPRNQDLVLVEQFEDYPEEIPLPDGTTALKSELTQSSGSLLEFDFAFIRYAEPIFESTLDDPGIVDLDTFEIKGDIQREIEPQWIKVKAGDTLENGLKVVSAQTPCGCFKDENGNAIAELWSGEIKLEGEITFEGIFEYFNGSEYYGYGDYFLCFYPDSTKYKIPVMYSDNPWECSEIQVSALGSDHALVYDGGYFYYFRFENDFRDMLTEDTVCKATMSFKDIVVSGRYILDGEITDANLEM